MTLTVRFDPAAPYEVEETDVPFARPEGKDTDTCIALMRDFIGRQLGRS